ncbi:hypothetical protein FKM82_027820 [Ascaphus truei]
MTLYPELMASAMYRISGSQGVDDPMYVYIGLLFGLQGIYVSALFVTSWIMSGTWLAGMLTVAWFIINRYEHGLAFSLVNESRHCHRCTVSLE